MRQAAHLHDIGGHDLDVEQRAQLRNVVVDALIGDALHGGRTDGIQLLQEFFSDLRFELRGMLRGKKILCSFSHSKVKA